MPTILAIDPAYKTLGLALVDTDAGEVKLTKTVNCGGSPFAFAKVLERELPPFLEFGDIAYIVAESPPIGMVRGQGVRPKSAAYIWCVMGGLSFWARGNKIPWRPSITPMALKQFAARTVGRKYRPSTSRKERKAIVGDAVHALCTVPESSSDHEEDAILVAFASEARAPYEPTISK